MCWIYGLAALFALIGVIGLFFVIPPLGFLAVAGSLFWLAKVNERGRVR